MDLLSTSEKNAFKQAVADAQQTWSRTITATKIGDKVILTEGVEYNYAYGDNQESVEVKQDIVQQTFQVRVHYIDRIDETLLELVNAGADLRLDLSKLLVRIRVETDAYNFLKDSKTAVMDGKSFALISSARAKYVFGTYYYYLYLQEVQ